MAAQPFGRRVPPVRDDAAASVEVAYSYTVLVSGSFNPPHLGHVRLGQRAAAHLSSRGHAVHAVRFVPVHDNYLANKAALNRRLASEARRDGRPVPPPPPPLLLMPERLQLLRELIAAEQPRSAGGVLLVADSFECSGAQGLLAESPGYWARALPAGYLRTVPSAALIRGVVDDEEEGTLGGRSCDAAAGKPQRHRRVAAVFGVDVFGSMVHWNEVQGIFASADLVIFARPPQPQAAAEARQGGERQQNDEATSPVHFAAAAAAPLGALMNAFARVAVEHTGAPVVLEGGRAEVAVGGEASGGGGEQTLFGHELGEFERAEGGSSCAGHGGGLLSWLPAVGGAQTACSSTSLRAATAHLIAASRHPPFCAAAAAAAAAASVPEEQKRGGQGGENNEAVLGAHGYVQRSAVRALLLRVLSRSAEEQAQAQADVWEAAAGRGELVGHAGEGEVPSAKKQRVRE